MYGMDSPPPASPQSSDYPDSSNTSGDGFLSWERSRQSSAFRGNNLDDDLHGTQQTAAVDENDSNDFGSDGAHNLYQQQEQHQIRPQSANSQPYQKTSPDESEDSDEKGINSPTPFRPMAPREFALGNTLRRSRSAMPMATLPADATVARKGSHDGGSQSVASASLASQPSIEQSEIESLQKLIQQQQMQTGIPPLPLQEQQQQSHNQQYMRQSRSTNDSMQRISETSGDSYDSINEPPEQSAGQHAGGEGFQQTAGEAAGECTTEQVSERASDRNYRQNERDEFHATGEQLNQVMTIYPVEMADEAAEAEVAAMAESSEDDKNQSLGYLSDDFQVYEGDLTESWRQSPRTKINVDGGGNDNTILEDISDNIEEGEESKDESVKKRSESAHSEHSSDSSVSSATGGDEDVDDDENDVDDISYAIGTEMGLHSRPSVDQSDISESASERESNNSSIDIEKMTSENTLDNVRQQSGFDTRLNETDVHPYIEHYLTSNDGEGTQDKIQSLLPAKRPLGTDATDASNEFADQKMTNKDSVSTLTAGDRFPLTSQTIAIADNVDTQEASGAITARFGRLLQECRDLTETCGDDSLRDSMRSSQVESATKTSSSNFRSSTTETEANEQERRLSSSQLKAAAAMAAANSSSLQRRSYSNPVTQKHEIDTSDGKHLHMSQLTVDPALHSSMIASDFTGSLMSVSGYKDLKSSTFTGLMNSAEIKESQSSEFQSVEEEEDPNQSEDGDNYAETFQVPIDRPLGRRAPRPVQPMARSLVSELSLGVDVMYGDADEDNAFNKSGNLNEDLTAPFDPSRFLAELNPSSFEASGNTLENAPSMSDSHKQHGLVPSNKDEEAGIQKIETNEAVPTNSSSPQAAADVVANNPSHGIANPVRPSSPSYISRASSYISSDFSADEGGLLVGFGQRNVKRSISNKGSVSSSSTSSGAFSSGSDSSSDESSSSGSSGSSSSSSDDDSESSSDGLDNIARDGLRIQSSRDSVSELSFGGASALMALQASRALPQYPSTPIVREEEEADNTDRLFSHSIHSTQSGSKNSSNESDQQVTNDSSRSERRASYQLEKLDEVSESTASDFLDDISSVGDNNNAVEKFFSSPTNEHENASIWSSATSTGLKHISVEKLLQDSFSSSSSPARNVNTEQRLSSSSRSSSLSSRSVSLPKSSRSQGTCVSGDKVETMQEAKSSSSLLSLSQNIPIQQSLTSEAAKEVQNVPTITKEDTNEGAVTNMKNSGSQESEKDSPSSLGSSGSRQNSFTRWKSITSSKSQDSSSAASSGSYYKGVLARAAAMNQDEDNEVQQLPQGAHEDEDEQDVVQASSYSHNLEKLLEASPSEDDIVPLQQGEDQILPLRSSSHSLENSNEMSPPQDDPIQIESENASLHRGNPNTIRPAVLTEDASEEVESDMHDDISSMSSVVSKARTSIKRASFIAFEETQKKELQHRQFDNLKNSMKSRYSYNEDELYEDFPSAKDDDEVIRRNRSSASQIVSESVETDARRPWKTAAREEAAAIPDESVLSAHTCSQRSSVISGQNTPEKKELCEENSDDDTNDEGSVSELFSSKEALKRMGLYASALNLQQNSESEDDARSFSGASEQNQKEQVAPLGESPRSTTKSIKEPPLDEESNISENDREKKMGSLRDSIRSSIQSIKEQFFVETRSNYSKSATSGQSIDSVKELNDFGQQQQTQQSVTSNDNSDGSLSLPKSNEAEESPVKSPARMLADTAREMTALLDHSISSRSLAASKANEADNEEGLGARKESSFSSASEEEVIAEVSPKIPKDDISISSQSKASDDQSISIDSLDDIESRIEVFKKKSKPAVDITTEDSLRVKFADANEEIGSPSISQRDDEISSNNKAASTEDKETENGANASWWKEMFTKPRLICGSVTIAVLIILLSSIGATVRNRNRSIPTNQPTPSPSRIIANWVKIGGDLKGEMPGDEAGFSISASDNGFTVIVGARRNGNSSDGTENRGAAQIFRFDALNGSYKSIWIEHGDAKGDQCGFSVAMSKDGRRVAVGCPGSDTYGKNSGKVRLFMEEEMSETWVMVDEFYGEGSGDLFGAAVSLSPEGTQLAVGAPYYTRNEVKRSGSAYAFREVSESVWQPSGNPMRGVVEESLFGWSVSLSAGGMFLAVGAPKMSESSLDGGFVKVFSSQAADGNDWKDYGDLITNGVPGDRFGFSVSIAGDETLQRVAIGAPGYSAIVEGGGLASVYEHSGNGWSNAGDDLISDIQGENLGYAVSLTPSANRLVVGVPKKQFKGEIVGQVQVFNVGYGSLTPAGEIYGLSGEQFGVSVAISNNGQRFFGGATDANLVRVYEDFPIVNFNS